VVLVVEPAISRRIEAFAGFFARFVPLGLAPLNWVFAVALIAACEGPVVKPKYLSIVFHILLAASILFFLGSWRIHPSASPVIGFLMFVELSWVIPLWEARINP